MVASVEFVRPDRLAQIAMTRSRRLRSRGWAADPTAACNSAMRRPGGFSAGGRRWAA